MVRWAHRSVHDRAAARQTRPAFDRRRGTRFAKETCPAFSQRSPKRAYAPRFCAQMRDRSVTPAAGDKEGVREHENPRKTGGCSVRDTGIEPVTSSVSGKRATAAPIAPEGCSVVGDLSHRADDETRTRDPNLGKVMRYQLRYIRMPPRDDSSTLPDDRHTAEPATFPGESMSPSRNDEAPTISRGGLVSCARYWDRTSDLFRVREARYRCANRAQRAVQLWWR